MTPATPAINRQLVAADLAALADLLAPAIEARMEVLAPLFSIPIVGARLRNLLLASPRAMTYAALVRILDLTDDELAALVDVAGIELGAWRGFNERAHGDDVTAAADAYERLLELV